jgi:hypothetical protein
MPVIVEEKSDEHLSLLSKVLACEKVRRNAEGSCEFDENSGKDGA